METRRKSVKRRLHQLRRSRPPRASVAPAEKVAAALEALHAGDFSVRLDPDEVPVRLAAAFNALAERNEALEREMIRVHEVVGREGRMEERVRLPGAAGGWDSVLTSMNDLVADLVQPTKVVARVIGAVAAGDLSEKMALDLEGQPLRGEFRRIGTTVNAMVDQLRSFAGEVTRVAREVGTEGKLGGQATVVGVSGVWEDLTANVNQMASNLTTQVRGIARVVTSVANGDLSQKLVVDAKGEIAELAETINGMTRTLGIFADQVTSVARTVGVEGKLGAQARVPGVSGVWKDLTDNVNLLANNLTAQVRNVAEVSTSVARGDLSRKITVDVRGEMLELKNTINTMVDQLRSFAGEVTRVAREVGTEGRLGGQAVVAGVSGVWEDLTENVNFMASNLTNQVRNIAKVTTAVADGDLSQKITVDVRGEMLELKNTINTMVDQLRSFAAEVTRVARDVGTEGKLGAQAAVPGVAGTWKDLTDNVNVLAGNLTGQVRNIAKVTTAVANGDLSQKISVEARGEIALLKETINTMVDQLRAFASEVTRVAKEVGTEGRLGGQAYVTGVSGTWKDLTDHVNSMASNLTWQVRNIAKVTTAVANGDLSQKITVDVQGEMRELKETINTMVEQLRSFAGEVTRVAREVGTEGKLGGQALVSAVAGIWKDLTDNVNFMASNLTDQVRGIVRVVTAVAQGDLSQKLVVNAKGEVAALAETINSMTDTLRTFADQVTTVAREVGIEGKLGGQARVPGAYGTWRHLTDNVNQLAGSLTTQIRAISEVATAVTTGDLTRSIDVMAQGEVATLKDNINQMIVNLKETTQKNAEQDWLKTNLARFSAMMQGQRDLEAVSRLIMSELTPLVSAHHGAFFLVHSQESRPVLKLISSFAWRMRKDVPTSFELGEGLVGQCALEKKTMLVTHAPPDYVQINSGLGEAGPLSLIILPVLFEGEVKAVLELASFREFSPIHRVFLDQLSETIGVVLNVIVTNTRTEQLLAQSQGLTQELQSQSRELTQQQTELRHSNQALEKQALELEEKARQLEERNVLVEQKNTEVEQARSSLEEKAAQLALISRYKSEFLANMSHELRTPLNSLLILARLLSENEDGNLSPKQVEYARTIHASGVDLLALINEILDLAKVESGKMAIEPRETPVEEVRTFVERTFAHVAEAKGLALRFEIAEDAPATLWTDPLRLQQVLKNLLGNAFKFTHSGAVSFGVRAEAPGAAITRDSLRRADTVLALSVADSGIGVPRSKHRLIFEAFQQADGTTSRKYGGTGLGLSISREIARLLGGEICVDSEPGRGSTFTLYLPARLEESLVAAATGGERPALGGGEVLAPAPAIPSLDELAGEMADTHSFAGRRVLVVDDDIRNIFALTSVLERRGFQVVSAEDGAAALEALRTRGPVDAVLMDVMMPEMDGYETTRAIRAHEEWRELPIIAVTAKALKEDRDRSLEAGATDYLSKPVDPARLVEVLRSHLR
jgi:signal transduction histidine kinase/HAMP domain-containing protein/CheY-like chemotaxis protein